MGEVWVFLKKLSDREAERELYKLLRRYKGRVVAVALVLELDSQQQAGALVRHYNVKPLNQWPFAVLIGDNNVL